MFKAVLETIDLYRLKDKRIKDSSLSVKIIMVDYELTIWNAINLNL